MRDKHNCGLMTLMLPQWSTEKALNKMFPSVLLSPFPVHYHLDGETLISSVKETVRKRPQFWKFPQT